jgi:formiminoglutamate deiminase
VENLHFDSALLPDGWARNVRLEIADGRVVRIRRGVDAAPRDERAKVALPGMPNVHSHGFQRGMSGLTEYRGPTADNFWSWRELMYRFCARMTPEDLEAVSAMAFVEMLEGGFTRVGEFHYVHHDPAGKPYADPAEMARRVAAACREAGIGLTLLPVFYAHAGFGGEPPKEGQRRFIHDVDGFARQLEACRGIIAELPGATLGVAPHSLRAVTPDELREVVRLAAHGPIHIHAAEQVKEVEDCVAWSGKRPVEWLLEHADLNERWCLVHATHLTNEEIARLGASGAVAGFCPVTEANLGDGIAPAAPLIAAGGVFGIGTDSNVSISARDELRQLEYAQRLRDRARNVIAGAASQSTGRALFVGALHGGSRALGQEDAGLTEGAAADFFTLDAESPALAEREGDALLDSFIFGGGNAAIDGVWCAGHKVVTRGAHHLREAVVRRYRAAVRRLIVGA